MSNLYVMQGDCGLIKVGRSHNVEGRRRALQSIHDCEIAIVAVVESGWDREEATHIALEQYRVIGEWFDGSESAKAAIVTELGLGSGTSWPFPKADPAVVDEWLAFVEGRRFLDACNKQFSALIRDMKRTPPERKTDPARYFDTHIWTILNRFGPSPGGGVYSERGSKGELVIRVWRDGADAGVVPRYTTDDEAALLVWPAKARPTLRAGSVFDCCVDGLQARKQDYAEAIRAELFLIETDQ